MALLKLKTNETIQCRIVGEFAYPNPVEIKWTFYILIGNEEVHHRPRSNYHCG